MNVLNFSITHWMCHKVEKKRFITGRYYTTDDIYASLSNSYLGYGKFFLQAQEGADVSGVLAVMTLGMWVEIWHISLVKKSSSQKFLHTEFLLVIIKFGENKYLRRQTGDRFYAAAARTAFKGDGQQSLHHFWYFIFLWFSIIKKMHNSFIFTMVLLLLLLPP